MTGAAGELLRLRQQLAAWRQGDALRQALANPELNGAGVRIALLDTGVNLEELKAQALRRGGPLPQVSCWRFQAGMHQPTLAPGTGSAPHGTTVADVLLTGVPAVELVSVDLYSPVGGTSVETLAAALHWVAAEGFRLVNLSMGVAESHLQPPLKRQMLWRAIEAAYRHDCFVVAAAHNDHPETKGYPALFTPALAGVQKAEVEPRALQFLPHEEVEFGAHGLGYFGPFSSRPANSWAAPHATALAAKLLQLEPTLRPFELKALLSWAAWRGGVPES